MVTIAIVILSLTSLELKARQWGYGPHYSLENDTWVSHWFRYEQSPRNQTVFLGASRIQFGINLDIWEDETGERPLVLAWPGGSAFPVLDKLSRDESFHGTVYCSIAPSFSFAPDTFLGVRRITSCVKSIEQKRWSLNYYLNQLTSTPLKAKLCILNASALSPLEILRQTLLLRNRKTVRVPILFPYHAYLLPDNQIRFTKNGESDSQIIKQLKDIYDATVRNQSDIGPGNIEELTQTITESVKRIKARGGRVIFVRFPSSGRFLELETKQYPREQYFDRIVRETDSIGIHFKDYPELSTLTCPEWSHLSTNDAKKFTFELIDIMRQHHVIPRRIAELR